MKERFKIRPRMLDIRVLPREPGWANLATSASFLFCQFRLPMLVDFEDAAQCSAHQVIQLTKAVKRQRRKVYVEIPYSIRT